MHGDVYLTHEEVRVLDTREMQRLRGVKQLGTAYLVYPGAVHTRFDHMIGSLYMAGKMIEAINLSFELDPASCVGVSEEEARVIRLAALVHDATHIPFGHSIEDQDGIFGRHDEARRFEAMFEASTGLGRVLRELGVHADVLKILTAKEGEGGIPPYWIQIVGGTIASDLLDYLARDAYFTGLKLSVDPRVTSYFKVDRQSGVLYIDLAKHDLLREDILSEVVRLLEARYYFSERVYYHHAKVAAGALIARAVETALAAEAPCAETSGRGRTPGVLDLLSRRSMEKAPRASRPRSRSRARPRSAFPRAPPVQARVRLSALRERGRAGGARRAFAFLDRRGGGATEAESRITDLVRFATRKTIGMIVYCPAQRMQLKEARMHVRWPGAASVEPLSAYAARVPRLADLERSYRDLWKFYVLADASEPDLLLRVQDAAAQEFRGAVNVYRIGGTR